MNVNVRIAGEAGQGVQTTGELLVNSFAGSGLYVFSTQSYMSRIRGGMNWFDIRISDRELFSGTEKADLLVALTEDALQALLPAVGESGLILSDGPWSEKGVSLGFTKTARDLTGATIMANSVAAGAVFMALGYDIKLLLSYLDIAFHKKGAEVVDRNIQCARRGAELASKSARSLRSPAPAGAPGHIYSGSQAVGLAAATAGVKLVSSYPMTPSTGVFTFLAGVADEYGIVVEQAEDEIAAVNMICGATYAGVPAMTTTSGGGFALMCEGLSLAGMMELPILIMLSQRPGPATGLPTRTAQEDLRFALSAGHGEFPRAIFAPGTLRQAYEATRRALASAHRFQTPVILMVDQFLMDMRKNIPALDRTRHPIDRHIVADAGSAYKRYRVTADGVSPRAAPGSSAFVVCDSDEHGKDGHITEDLRERVRLQQKRLAKDKGLRAEALQPEIYGREDAEVLLVAWGSTYGPCREAVDLMHAQGTSAAMLHFSQVWPLDGAPASALLRGDRRVVVIEGNSTGQFASILRQVGLVDDCELVLKYDGMPFTGEEIAARIQQ